VSVVLGKLGGTFSPQTTYFISGYPCGPNSLIAADFNGDGKLDLAVGSLDYDCSGKVSVLLGNGDGTFQSPVTYTSGGRSSGIVAADLNGDGKLDLAVADFARDRLPCCLATGTAHSKTPSALAWGCARGCRINELQTLDPS
jgi:hypothetical protein